MTSESVLGATNQYLSTIDTADRKADDRGQEHVQGDSLARRSAGMLICSPEWRTRYFRRVRIDFVKQRWREATLPKRQAGQLLGANGVFTMNPRFLVAIVDDDDSVRESLPDLLRVFGFGSQTFSSAEEFLAKDGASRSNCLILDVAMPGMSGPELQKEFNRRKIKIPIIFITGNRNETLRSRLIEQGAIACLTKPLSNDEMLEALNSALQIK